MDERTTLRDDEILATDETIRAEMMDDDDADMDDSDDADDSDANDSDSDTTDV